MRGAICGLTIEIGGDTTKLQPALKGVNSEVVNKQKQMQLNFLWKELSDIYPVVLIVLQNAENVREASDVVLLWDERPADTSAPVQEKRTGYGQGYYDKYAGAVTNSVSKEMSNVDCPFLVRVTAKNLRIRADAGTDKNGQENIFRREYIRLWK